MTDLLLQMQPIQKLQNKKTRYHGILFIYITVAWSLCDFEQWYLSDSIQSGRDLDVLYPLVTG